MDSVDSGMLNVTLFEHHSHKAASPSIDDRINAIVAPLLKRVSELEQQVCSLEDRLTKAELKGLFIPEEESAL